MKKNPKKNSLKSNIVESISRLKLVKKGVRKGQNGKFLIIGGSNLFHSPPLWAAQLASHFVDLVFVYSPAFINREIILQSKTSFRNGIVIESNELEDYVREADVILLGPGMKRRGKRVKKSVAVNSAAEALSLLDEGQLTQTLTHYLLTKYPNKKWVLDAGALQEIELLDMQSNMIATPHEGEFSRLFPQNKKDKRIQPILEEYVSVVGKHPSTWLIKHRGKDYVVGKGKVPVVVENGNEGLTKGGTGDVLSTLVGILHIHNDARTSCACASYILKETADVLYKEKGPFYTTSELVEKIPSVIWGYMSKSQR
ncbi:MAG: hypothetical protein NUV65_06585 [Candidatus Roizmanbacteria bacterium]|nr:hypothetical protein [Candidatus Roizmanbacteria bacterium]